MRSLTLKSIANEKLDLEIQYPIRLVRNDFHEGSTQLNSAHLMVWINSKDGKNQVILDINVPLQKSTEH